MSDKRTEEFYDRIASTYDDSYQHKLDLTENRMIARMISGYTGGAVVDLGCGTGLALDIDGIDHSKYIGIDISQGMLLKAMEKYPEVLFRQVDMIATQLPDQIADNVISLFGGLSHCQDLFRAVNEIHRILKPGGKFFIMLYNMDHIKKRDSCIYGSGIAKHYSTPYSAEFAFRQFDGVKADLFSLSYSWLPTWLPFGLYEKLFQIEADLFPDRASYVIVTGQKSYPPKPALTTRLPVRRG